MDFVQIQSMRSRALARKTNTTSKFSQDCKNLFEDLLALNEKDYCKNNEEKREEKNEQMVNFKKIFF